MTIQAVLYQMTATIFLLLGIVGLSNPTKVNITANRWFGLFFITVALMLLNKVLYEMHLDPSYQRLIGFSELTRFMMAPALYMAIICLTRPGGKLSAKHYLHFIPLALFWTCILPGLMFLGSRPVLPFWMDRVFHFLFMAIAKLQLPVYCALSIYTLIRHEKNIRLIVSNVTLIDLRWLKYLLITLSALIVLFMVYNFAMPNTSPVWIAFVAFIGSLFVVHYLLAQQEVYAYEPEVITQISEVIDALDDVPGTTKPKMDQEELTGLKLRLEELMNKDKFYLHNELSLPQLAAELTVTTHDLSWLLNQEYGLNFFNFVNTYRVAEAKRLLLSEEHRHLNMLGIAYGSGFNSKTTFNTAFKKETGLSPTQFIRNTREDLSSKLA